MPFVQPTTVDHLPRERVQAYLDELAMLSVRHAIVVDSGSLVPRRDEVGGYLLAAGGYLHTYPVGDREVRVVTANLREAFAQRQPRTLTADIAGITAHDLIRRSAGRGDKESA
jgi:hypothetical protein